MRQRERAGKEGEKKVLETPEVGEREDPAEERPGG